MLAFIRRNIFLQNPQCGMLALQTGFIKKFKSDTLPRNREEVQLQAVSVGKDNQRIVNIIY